MRTRGILAAAAAALGLIAAFAGEPRPSREGAVDVRKLAGQVAREEDHVTARELATWIRERKDGLRVIDVRSAGEFSRGRIPGARNVAIESLVNLSFAPGDTVVLYSDGGAHAAQAWVLLRASGIERVYFLRGGLREWSELLTSDRGMRDYFGGAPETRGLENGGC
jgi:rhodanese-related sulfurtransferase